MRNSQEEGRTESAEVATGSSHGRVMAQDSHRRNLDSRRIPVADYLLADRSPLSCPLGFFLFIPKDIRSFDEIQLRVFHPLLS